MIINNKTYNRPLLVFALEAEASHLFDEYTTIFTGVGKVNAGYRLLKAVHEYQPDVIINLGTAGSTTFNRGSVVCCTQFVQRDMDVTGLGFEKFVTPFEESTQVLTYGEKIDGFFEGICGSGDNFETNHTENLYNVVEMEAFALAKVSLLEKIPFVCLKYISDGADGSALDDWQVEVKKAASALKEAVLSLQ